MYAKKLDDADITKGISPFAFLSPTSPPEHSFKFTFYKSKKISETCYSRSCPRQGTFSPLEWSRYRIKGGINARNRDALDAVGIICADGRRDCYNQRFCNEDCFVKGWRESKVVPPGTYVKVKHMKEVEVRFWEGEGAEAKEQKCGEQSNPTSPLAPPHPPLAPPSPLPGEDQWNVQGQQRQGRRLNFVPRLSLHQACESSSTLSHRRHRRVG